MSDPYCYNGTEVLKNKLGIRDAQTLRLFEIEATTQRLSEGIPSVLLTPAGYRAIHRHIFQDVYEWAGKYRTIDISKGVFFGRAEFIEGSMERQFALLHKTDDARRRASVAEFASDAAKYLAELNAIHPFREGNGRTNRGFLKALGFHYRRSIDLTKIDPVEWMKGSVESFDDPERTETFQAIILRCLDASREPAKPRAKGRGPQP